MPKSWWDCPRPCAGTMAMVRGRDGSCEFTMRTALMELRRRRQPESLLADWGWIRRRVGVRDEVDRISLCRALAALPETQ